MIVFVAGLWLSMQIGTGKGVLARVVGMLIQLVFLQFRGKEKGECKAAISTAVRIIHLVTYLLRMAEKEER